MRIQHDFREYQKSIAAELIATKDRVRHLIGGKHWLSDGEHKEAVLRKVLRTHVQETMHVGTGFVCGPDIASHQTDILLTYRDKPALFRDGELVVVTPDAAARIIEVKTRVRRDKLVTVLRQVADDVEMIRSSGNNDCRAGLFIYEMARNLPHEWLLEAVQQASGGSAARVVNWIAAGPDRFVRYWDKGSEVNSPVAAGVWHSYAIERLAFAYFVSNVIWDTGEDDDPAIRSPWFSIDGGKEQLRKKYVALDDPRVMDFPQRRHLGGGRNG